MHNSQISTYDPIESNCQHFVTNILQALGVERLVKLTEFYVQDWRRAFEPSDIETIREIAEISSRYFGLGSMHEAEFKSEVSKLKLAHPFLFADDIDVSAVEDAETDIVGDKILKFLTWRRKLRLLKLK